MQFQHHYRPTLRPASRYTLPEGVKWEYVEVPSEINRPDLPRSNYRHGVIALDRALTADEREHFDLVLV